MTVSPLARVSLFFVFALAGAVAQTVELSPVFVTAGRSGEASAAVPFSHVALSGAEVRDSANVSIDGALRGIAGFSLFRRTDSLVAHPTTQGVSLRGLGPSGASRSLVLLDGVPLNDPFGGWVLWSKVPRESLAGIEIVPGAGGTAWGNAALGGVIQLFTEPAEGTRERLAVRGGSFGTYEVEGQVTEPVGSGTIQLLGRDFATDGFYVVAPEDRGAIDRPASSRARWLTGRWRQPLGDGIMATLTLRRFTESRGNGTPYQQNGSEESFASLAVAGEGSASFRWTATAYAQGEGFSSTFSSVDATRSTETPASNQFDVPATAIGLGWVGEWRASEDAHTTAGFDVRDTRGETREDSAYSAGAFTRRRFAGGRQATGGLFVVHSRKIAEEVHGSVGLRADDWEDSEGHRRDYLNGAVVGDEHFARHEGIEFSPSAGLVWSPAGAWRWHASAQQAFRRPTLNELYRPFRVGNVITDANPALRTERVTSAEVGGDFRQGPVTFGATLFWNELHDAVGNVTIAEGPGTFPGIGFVPAGGEGRRRLNLDRSRVEGATLTARWQVTPEVSVDAQYLYDDAKVRSASVAPQLAGLRLAQVPQDSTAVGLTWKAGRWSVAPRLRWIGAQFEDDQNTLVLAPATIVDVAASFEFHAHAEAFVSAENLFDERVETGTSGSGLVNIGTPRLWLVGVRWTR